METTAKKVAAELLGIKAVFLSPAKPFTWASGIKSPIYCDNRLILTAPKARKVVEEAIAATVREKFPEAEVLMGTSTAGIAHAACAAWILDMPMGYVRGGNKDHGRGNRIEGKLEKGQKSCGDLKTSSLQQEAASRWLRLFERQVQTCSAWSASSPTVCRKVLTVLQQPTSPIIHSLTSTLSVKWQWKRTTSLPRRRCA